jgi:hypothetical protein
MVRSELRHPTIGTVFGGLAFVFSLSALIVALSSSADALSRHATIHKGDIAAGAVTAKALARGAVHPKALAKGAVNSKALAKGAVTANGLAKGAVTAAALAHDSVTVSALADDAVTAGAIAPSSVYGGALGTQTIHTAGISDLDEVAENGTWTSSDTSVASCAPGERLQSGYFNFSNPGNREVAFLGVRPFINGDTAGVTGRITSNSGGTAAAEIEVVCLK